MPDLEINNTKKIKDSTRMRNAFIRISAINVTNFDDESKGIKAGDVVTYSKQDILDILENWRESRDFKYYLIEHNHDEENLHYHIVLDFPNHSSSTFKTIKNKFPYGNISRCRYGVKNCVQYLVHMNEEDKEKYDWSEVITNAPDKLEDYKIPGKRNREAKLQKVLDAIVYGSLKRYEINKIEPDIYIRHGRKIERAFEYREKILLAKPSRNVSIYVLQGETGSGKSTFCKKWAEDNNQSIYYSSASNDPWQDYNGQDIFVYDDFRPNKIAIEDFMKSIDPYVNSTASGRYRNKLFIGDTIFLTTNIHILEWFKGSDQRTRDAFFRRISKVLEFEKDPINEGTTIINLSAFSDDFTELVKEDTKRFDIAKYINKNSANKECDFNDKLNRVLTF